MLLIPTVIAFAATSNRERNMNRLGDQTSPYLLEHADNPVDWQPWDDEALALAKREKKPILLSIGYSANYFCRLMAHESFTSHQVAKLMNENFINIKVDREERPDLDRVYQTALQLLMRQRSDWPWPLTIFLDPDNQVPFFAGTYFPPQGRHDAPGFRDVLKGIAQHYSSSHGASIGEQLKESEVQIRGALEDILGGGEPGEIDPMLLERACGQIDSSFDEEHGGFSDAPKFSPHSGLEILFDAALDTEEEIKSKRASHLLDFTLNAMSRGGLYDHLGGGFFRNVIDADWTKPNFEKMLFDNGQILSLFARRARQTGAPWLREVANRTADWILREMQQDSGGICASLNADIEREEGKYYTWTLDDIAAAIGDDYDTFVAHYIHGKKPNFEGNWHLRLAAPQADLEDWQDNPVADLPSPASLLTLRQERGQPGRNEKILTAWNALAIRGLADAGQHLDRPDCVEAASRAVDYVYQANWRDGRLFVYSRDGGAHVNAYLDDYALLIDALLALLSARWRDSDLSFAIALADVLIEQFEDPDKGGFFFTANDSERLIQRQKTFVDDSLPSGNGTAVRALLELGRLIGETRYIEVAERALRAGMTAADSWPSAHATLIRGLLDLQTPAPRVVLRCADSEAAADWVSVAAEKLTTRSRIYVIPNNAAHVPGAYGGCTSQESEAVTAYVCTGQQCGEALLDRDSFAAALAD